MVELRFRKEQRLLRRPEFTACFDHGRRYFSKHFVLFVLPRPERTCFWRLGMAVGKRLGSAVRRNRIKRVVRECFRLHRYDIPDGLDIVVVPKRRLDARSLNMAMAVEDFLPIFRRLGPNFDPTGEATRKTGDTETGPMA